MTAVPTDTPRQPGRAGRLLRLLAGLLTLQAASQLIGILSGFALLRWLSIDDYAQYTIAFGFAATLSSLVDVGFASAIMPLVGDRAREPAVFGAYLRAALYLRGRLAAVAIPISAVAFFVLTSGRGWGVPVQIGLYASIPLTLFARAMVDVYSLPLLMQGRYRAFYSGQIGSAGLRLFVLGSGELARGLTSVTASLINAACVLVNGVVYRRRAVRLVHMESTVEKAKVREILGIIAPVLPGTLFTAFQGQITILLISVFGAVRSIAEVGALSRLAGLFAVLGGITGVLVAPRFPQLPRDRLLRETTLVLGLASLFVVTIGIVAFVWPDPLLLLLGSRYDGLGTEVAWFVVGSGLAFVAGVGYAINLARRFIWYWSTWLGLGLIISSQILGVVVFDLGSTLELQYFAVLSGFATCLAQAVALLYGFRRGPRAT